MKQKTLDRLPMTAAVALVVLIVAACAFRLRDDENQNTSATSFQASDPPATKLAECRSVTYEQKDALSECRKVWAERRHQFVGQTPPTSPERAASQGASPLFIPPEDGSDSRLGPPLHNSIPQSGKE
jgi:conjugative transfer region protein TrbK